MRRNVSDCPAPSTSVFVVTGAISQIAPSCASALSKTLIGQPFSFGAGAGFAHATGATGFTTRFETTVA